jgi:hypothetical protein
VPVLVAKNRTELNLRTLPKGLCAILTAAQPLKVCNLVATGTVFTPCCLVKNFEHCEDARTSMMLGCHKTLYTWDVLMSNSHGKLFPFCKMLILYANLVDSIERLQLEVIEEVGLPLKQRKYLTSTEKEKNAPKFDGRAGIQVLNNIFIIN